MNAARHYRSEARKARRMRNIANRISYGLLGLFCAAAGTMLAALAGWLYSNAIPADAGLFGALLCAVFAFGGVCTMFGGVAMAISAIAGER